MPDPSGPSRRASRLSRAGRRRAHRALLVLALLGSLLLGAVGGLPAPAVAAPGPADEAITRVLLDELAPVLPEPGRAVSVVGRVVEGEAVTAIRLAVGRPVDDRRDLAAADRRPGYATRLPPQPLTAEARTDGARTFSLSASPDDLGLGPAGVYPLGVEALVGDVVFARTDTFLPWFPDGAPSPVGLGVLLPVTAPPLLAPGGALREDVAERAGRLFAPTGRLGRLVEAAAPSGAVGPAPVTWAVDADVLRTAEELAAAGAGADAAAAWLAALRELVQLRAPVALPYADADLPALVRAEDVATAREAVATGEQEAARLLGVPPAAGVVWPAPGELRRDGVAALADGGTRTLVLRESDAADLAARAGRSGRGGVGSGGVAGVDVLVPDARLSALASPASSDLLGGDAVPRQRMLVETALIAAEREAGAQEEEAAVVLALPRGWEPSTAWARVVLHLADAAPWLRPAEPLEAAGDLPDEPGPGAPGRVPDPDPLDADWMADVAALEAGLGRLAVLVLPDDDGVLAPQRRSVLRTASAAWRAPTEVDRGRRLLRATSAHLRDLLGAVRLSGADVVTLTSDAGDLPVTVTNGLPARVEVTVQIDAGGEARLAADAAPRLVLAPESSQTVTVPVRAGASGRFRVEVQLANGAGEPVGQPQEVLVRVTAVGRLALAITTGAVAVLLLASGVRLMRRGLRATRGREPA